MRNVDELLQEINASTLTKARLVLLEPSGSTHTLHAGSKYMRDSIADALKLDAVPVGISGRNQTGAIVLQVAPESMTDEIKAAEILLRSFAA
jgi:hypothetical protein